MNEQIAALADEMREEARGTVDRPPMVCRRSWCRRSWIFRRRWIDGAENNWQVVTGVVSVDRHRLPPHGVAKAILNCTRREVLAQLGVGCHGKLRDKVWIRQSKSGPRA